MPNPFKNQCKWARWCYWDKILTKPEKKLKQRKCAQCAHFALAQLLMAKKEKKP